MYSVQTTLFHRGIEILYFRSTCFKCGWISDKIYQIKDEEEATRDFEQHICNSQNLAANI